jgi:hypothetical protein
VEHHYAFDTRGGSCVCVCVCVREREREREIAFSIDAILRFLIVFFMFFKCFDVKDE